MPAHPETGHDTGHEWVTVAEVNDFLADSLALSRERLSSTRDARLAYHERKAQLLTRIAADLGTAAAHQTAAGAWRQLAELRAPSHPEDAEAGDV